MNTPAARPRLPVGLTLLLCAAATPLNAQVVDRKERAQAPAEEAAPLLDREAIARTISKGLEYLLANQNADGSFGGIKNATFTTSFANPATFKCWQIGASALAVRSLLELGQSDAAHGAVERGLDFLVANAEPLRPADWDVDNNWAIIYGLDAVARALRDPRYAAGTARHDELRAAAAKQIQGLAKYQSPRGGWGYYADPNSGWRPDWATSFTTAAAVLALVEAKQSGLEVDEKVFRAGVKAVRMARLPNGAYDYEVSAVPGHLTLESINQVKGSLGRIQVCNLALYRAGDDIGTDQLARGLQDFVRDHKFLAVARNKPIPHEAYYANAAYFYLFAHYYAAQVLELLPADQRAPFAEFVQAGILDASQPDGSMWDFYIASNTKAYGTAFGILGLQRTLDATK
ncbi:MAG: hypothetical protein R3F49_16230 [Planctomycetota bacterium]